MHRTSAPCSESRAGPALRLQLRPVAAPIRRAHRPATGDFYRPKAWSGAFGLRATADRAGEQMGGRIRGGQNLLWRAEAIRSEPQFSGSISRLKAYLTGRFGFEAILNRVFTWPQSSVAILLARAGHSSLCARVGCRFES